ncbi:MAG: putative Ig domain-containing protein [Colwellia sp.]|jgi:hypothetical protein
MKSALAFTLLSFTLSGCITINNSENQEPDQDSENTQHEEVNDPEAGGTPATTDSPIVDEPPVIGTNLAPSISGTPITEVEINSYYSFKPQAQDPEGEVLFFIIDNLPAWASFNVNTGEISGTPELESSHQNIVISASDGTHTISLDAFNMNVFKPTPPGITIKWQAPVEDVNDEPIGAVKAYKIFYGTTQGNYDKSITINDGNTEVFVIQDLEPGDYYFAMLAISDNGRESAMSSEHYLQVSQ